MKKSYAFMAMNKITILLLISISTATTVTPVSHAGELNSSQPYLDDVTLQLPLSVSGDAEAQSQFGLSVSMPTTVEPVNNTDWRKTALLIEQQKYQQAVTLLLPLAKSGDAESQTQLGSLYENGLDVPRNLDIARRWYQSAAEQNYPRAQVNLGFLYQFGIGASKDLSSAVYWYKQAVALKDPRAKGKLAYLYLTEPDYAQDEKKAVRLLESSADAGYVEAQFNLAMFLLRGEKGLVIDKPRAINLLQRSADQNSAPALNMLALLYYLNDTELPVFLRDIKLQKNTALAHQFFQRATALGSKDARRNLSRLCRKSPEVCQIKN